MVTRNDVARLAGVSPSVVSYVINNSNYVSEAKRKAVLDAIRQLNYIPNVNAKNLRQGRTNMVASVRGSQLNDLFSSILLYLEQYAGEKGYTMTSISTLNNAKGGDFFAQDSFVDTLISRHYDAVFISNSAFTAEQLNRLAQTTKVVLFVSRDYAHLDSSISRIIPDYEQAVHDSVKKLMELGHTRISLLPNLSYPMSQRSPENHRFSGYCDAFREAKLPIDFYYVPDGMDSMDALESYVEDMFFSRDGHLPPTAICTDEAFILARLAKILRARGIYVPRDVSLICFSRSTISDLVTPAMSGFGFSHHGFARTVMDLMDEMIQGGTARDVIIPLNFSEGESIAPPKAE